MFAFLTSIRHPNTAKNYERVLDLLNLTIGSVLGQNSNNPFVFVIVCNERPKNIVVDSRVIFFEVDFPPASNGEGSNVDFESLKIDKGSKIAAGLLFLRKFDPKYVYVIDADDWVNVRAIDYLINKNFDLCFANTGYLVDLNHKRYLKKYGVCRYCGSTHIYRYQTLLKISGLSGLHINENLGLDYFKENIDKFILKQILGNHRHQISFFKNKGLSVKSASIPLVAWVVNNGENHSSSYSRYNNKIGLSISEGFERNFSVQLGKADSNGFLDIAKSLISSLKSWIGWLMANKNEDKI